MVWLLGWHGGELSRSMTTSVCLQPWVVFRWRGTDGISKAPLKSQAMHVLLWEQEVIFPGNKSLAALLHGTNTHAGARCSPFRSLPLLPTGFQSLLVFASPRPDASERTFEAFLG